MMLCETGKVSDISKYHLKGWVGQQKIDGCRCLAICSQGVVQLKGRSGTDYTSKFPEIVEELKNFNVCFDGEIMCDTFEHTSSRVHTENKLKSALLVKEYPAIFYIFDEITPKLPEKPLLERFRGLIAKDFSQFKHLCLLPLEIDLIGLWERAKKENWEGIILKRADSKYENRRSWAWLKIKKEITKDIIVDSYAINPAGIRAESSKDDLAVQITGSNSVLVKKQIDETGSCKIEVKGLEITENNKIRQIVFKDVKN